MAMNLPLEWIEPSLATLVAVGTTTLAVMVYGCTSSRGGRSKGNPAKRPPRVTSYLPWVGSAIEMGSLGILGFIRKYSRKLNDAPVFSATILGDKCIFLAESELLTTVFRPALSKKLDSETSQRQFIARVLGADDSSMKEIFTKETFKAGLSQYHRFLFKGEELDVALQKVQIVFQQQVSPMLARHAAAVSDTCDDWVQVSLFDLILPLILKATTTPFFSESIATDEMVQLFSSFDQGVLNMYNRVPNFLVRASLEARDTIKRCMGSNEFWKTASPLMQVRKTGLSNLSKESLQVANLGLFWASLGNSVPAIFWTTLQLLQHPQAFEACRDQVLSIVKEKQHGTKEEGTNTSMTFSIDDLDKMTLLQSAFLETLRFYTGNMTARRVIQDFVLSTPSNGDYFIEKDTQLMSFWPVLHMDPAVFANVKLYQFDRFVNVDTTTYKYASGKQLPHAPIMSFGGGSHLCPGRKFVSYETRMFLAMLVVQFDLRVAEGSTTPGIDMTKQGLGVSHPDRKFFVEIRKKEMGTL